ncbi:MAG: DUF3108 domain-containing protein [Oryzomonas sp.]|uniref:DUF3108 domain-containing protein n=1 Tax=Oryzomonas sp. TaxID=2855186 RepID=UPI002842F49F|nr:DUF3108 domain-containing protein [Oryzomonas sp.]MDR3581338.1 DUF3108 domain-containing protein [Oryzomonas sp.]
MVDVVQPRNDAAPSADSDGQKTSPADNAGEDVPDAGNHARAPGEEAGTPPAAVGKDPVEPKSVKPIVIDKEKTDSSARTSEPAPTPQPTASRHNAAAVAIPPPLRTAAEFLSSKSEKLSYLITLLGVPVGSVELEAKNENNEVRITLRTRTNTVLSSIYPVDDFMETRHTIGGNFIMTKIRQQEGSFRSDIGFTLFLRDKRVFWIDRIRNRYSNETVPTSDVLDTLSSFYYLRNRPLQTGTTVILHVYDGDTYALVPVEIVRQEEVRLRNFKKVDSLLLRHVKQKGIFRRTGDMSIWLTNDGKKVPVRVETTSPFGTVAVELVSTEITPQEEGGKEK